LIANVNLVLHSKPCLAVSLSSRRNNYQRKLQSYRIDKHIPKRAKITIEEDLGKRKLTRTWTTPRLEATENNYPKKRNEEWIDIYHHNGLKIRRNIKDDRFCMYANNEFLGYFEPADLYMMSLRLLDKLNAFTTVIYKKVKKKKYERYMLRYGKTFKQWRDRRS
jgi:hypothetical protein